MQNENTKFNTLLEHGWSILGKSADDLKATYKDYPICLIEYIEKEVHEHIIEVRFDNEEATISISFDKENKCDASFLFFDSTEKDELLISHLIDSADYDFRKGCFELPSCSLKIKETKTETCFYLFR
ncbi:hypothetical protein [Dysgonomonas sp. HGC4]|uniref:hypothetical protein n=1 Tax=Dysgonomonas sp. HGC4 TaxID=1658009 RepID=UPI000683606E|nr:hypothetical protein [Dysgonomonas sp. HGC4]MBD8347671.1 hypothetical protein [Dysgonomonas sp. HGC4]